MVLAHYPEWSPFQSITKFIRGWSRVLAAGESKVAKGTSCQHKPSFELLRDNPQELLQSPWLRHFGWLTDDTTFDPIAYRGGPLRFTLAADDAMRAARSLVGYVELLSREHGRLLEECPGARGIAAEWAITLTHVVGVASGRFVFPVGNELVRQFVAKPRAEASLESAADNECGFTRQKAGAITVHVQNVGDMTGSLGDWIGERGSCRWIEDGASHRRRTFLQTIFYIVFYLSAMSYRLGCHPADSAVAWG